MGSTRPKRILLLNPPVYDIRLDWGKWHQPCGLLKLGSQLRARGHDARLIDGLHVSGTRVLRTKHDSWEVSGTKIDRWQFGLSWEQFERRVRELTKQQWKPHAIYVTCMMTFWWESARDLVAKLDDWLPGVPIWLGGVYPKYASSHAKEHFETVHFDQGIGLNAKHSTTNLDLYSTYPPFAGISIQGCTSERIVRDIERKLEGGTREFAFFDEEIGPRNVDRFVETLEELVRKGLRPRMLALGNISPQIFDRSTVKLMRKAGYRQIFLRDDNPFRVGMNGDLSIYERAVSNLFRYAGYRPRTDEVTAMVVVGVPGENLVDVVERLVRLSHIVGSVNVVPFQPTPGTKSYELGRTYLDKIPLERMNGKLFPLAKVNGHAWSDYEDLLRLARLLNSKYRSKTFDFLAEGGISGMANSQAIADYQIL